MLHPQVSALDILNKGKALVIYFFPYILFIPSRDQLALKPIFKIHAYKSKTSCILFLTAAARHVAGEASKNYLLADVDPLCMYWMILVYDALREW